MPSRRILVPAIAVVAVGLIATAAVAVPATGGGGPRPTVDGIAPGAALDRAALDKLAVRVDAPEAKPGKLSVTLDGRRLTGDGDTYRLGSLPDGSHTLVAAVKGRFPWSSETTVRRAFTVDTTAPALDVTLPKPPIPFGKPATFTGTTEPGATVAAAGATATADAQGHWTLTVPKAKSSVTFTSTDKAGNVTTKALAVPVERPPYPEVRAVHMTAYAWVTPSLRDPILAMLRQKKINAIELDIKDESGIVGYDSQVPLARQIGAVNKIYDLKQATAQIHAAGGRAIGRLVCFRDAVLAGSAWKAGHRDEVVQSPDGQPYKGYGGFTNFANPVVQRYQIDLGVEAVHGGFDDILYDYVRRPDGPISTMRFPGLKGTPEAGVAGFVKATRDGLEQTNAALGVSVFGVSATRPTETAQDIGQLAKYVDYVAPMVYPSHWATGEYNVANPNSQPYAIVQRSLKDFQNKARGTKAKVVPWLQDFSLGVTYNTAEVQAQLKGAADDGIPSFILWDAGATYHADALTADAPSALTPT